MKNYQKVSLLALIALAFLYTSISYQNKSIAVPTEDQTRNLSSIKKTTLKPQTQKVEAPSTVNEKFVEVFTKYLPISVDNEEWAHKVTTEDDTYLSTILTIDTKNLDTYVYRWKKENGGLVLVAGEIPKPLRIEGNFPTESEKMDIIKNIERPDLQILKSQEVWDLSYDNILRPTLKTEVQYTKLGRIHHEYWYINPENSAVTQVRSIDRH